MNCRDVRRLIPLALDHELSCESEVEVERHLDSCPDCSQRLDAERGMEARLRQVLSETSAEEDEAWSRALERVQDERPKRWVMAAAALVVLSAVLGWSALSRGDDTSLTRAMLASHEKYLAGQLEPQLVTTSAIELEDFFEERFSFETGLGGASEGARLLGGRTCFLDRSPCAFVMAQVENSAVSLFLFDSEQLSSFPSTARALAEHGSASESRGGFQTVVWAEQDRVVAAIGELERTQLESVVRQLSARLDDSPVQVEED